MKRPSILLIIIISSILIVLTGLSSFAYAMNAPNTTYTVDRLTDHDVVGGGEGTGTTGDLRYALTNAQSGESIGFSVIGTINLAGSLPSLTHSITIDGPGPDELTINGAGTRVFSVSQGATVVISGLTVTGGRGNGGGIFNAGTLTLNQCAISGNSAGEPTNGGGTGGGIWNYIGGTLTLNNSTVNNNTVFGSSFYNPSRGGGIANYGTLTINNSTISGNSASEGAGGGISNTLPTSILTLNNSTLSGNSVTGAAGIGAGIDNRGTLYAVNTIIAGNTGSQAPDLLGILSSQGHNIIGNTNGGSGFRTDLGDLLNLDPKLGPLQNNGGPTATMGLLVGSPAIDAGDDSACAAAPINNLDQRGVARPQGVHCDIGAYEGSDSSSSTATQTPTSTPTQTPTSTPIQIPTSTPTGTPLPSVCNNVAFGKPTNASAVYNVPGFDSSQAVDGDLTTLWNAGDFGPQWIEIDLGSPSSIDEIRLYVAQSPEGDTSHEIWVADTSKVYTMLETFNGFTMNEELLDRVYNPSLTSVQWVKVVTTASPSWVAWFEIEVCQTPASMPTHTPTNTPTSAGPDTSTPTSTATGTPFGGGDTPTPTYAPTETPTNTPTYTPTPTPISNTPGKVTGGGTFWDTTGIEATLGFTIKFSEEDAEDASEENGSEDSFEDDSSPEGNLTYQDHTNQLRLKAIAFDRLVIDPDHAWFAGTGIINDEKVVSFRVDIYILSKNGSSDVIYISIPEMNSYTAGGALAGGNLVIHNR